MDINSYLNSGSEGLESAMDIATEAAANPEGLSDAIGYAASGPTQEVTTASGPGYTAVLGAAALAGAGLLALRRNKEDEKKEEEDY